MFSNKTGQHVAEITFRTRQDHECKQRAGPSIAPQSIQLVFT